MSRFSFRINPFVRGLLILAAIAGVIVVLQLEQTLFALAVISHASRSSSRSRISSFSCGASGARGSRLWSQRARWVFYGAAVVAVVDVGVYWYGGAVGYEILAFVAVLALCGFAMWRTWRDQHTYV